MTAVLPLAAGASPRKLADEFKSALAREREILRQAFTDGLSAAELLQRLSRAVDRQLRQTWRTCALPAEAALVAVGGYGRGRLFPCSDVDLLILLPDAPGAPHQHEIEAFVSMLWDMGLEVGHS